ncbi:nicotinamide riboside transporter PnuC [Marinobacterium jannaschii]|uniref:nicotinamide riboside transporter PnuC n=1 Tax=Marinobacterium jannaschii TaxID=64970 RepID=UPI00047FBF0A|nr:nicotinamide riboside transporter PnuC [Marinobacterium jannaschii]
MSDLLQSLVSGWQMMSGWELVAVLLSLAYLWLAMMQNRLCWYAAFASTLIFSWLFWDASLLMESALNLYYLGMAAYGWYQWRGPRPEEGASSRPITTWSLRQHLLAIGSIAAMTLLSGSLLADNTSAALPYVDSFTTWGAVLTTYMVAQKKLENWIYWLVIDGVSVWLFIDRGLMLTAALFAVYEVMVIFGFRQWYRAYRDQQQAQWMKLA